MNTHAPLPSFDIDTFDFSVVSPGAALAVRALLEAKARDRRAAVEGEAVNEILGCSSSQREKLRNAGKIASFTDGARRKYPPGAAYDFLIAQAIESNPLNAAPRRVREPLGAFKAGHRPPPRTPAQMKQFERANSLRISRAQARRAVTETI
jgi:hypothetical protein